MPIFLRDISPKDKPWDKHGREANIVRDLLKGTEYDRLAQRIDSCSGELLFDVITDPDTGEQRLKLRSTRFCRVRVCPKCQWRHSLGWRRRFYRAVPLVLRDYPTARFILLTLTVRNCPIGELRSTLARMNKAWDKLLKRKNWPAIGFVRAVEVTRNNDPSSEWHGTAHPHFHVLLMVKPAYFSRDYINQQQWAQMWQQCLQVDYEPRVDVRIIRSKEKAMDADSLMLSLLEVLKYSVKPDDLCQDRDWLLSLVSQLHKTRSVSVGGVLRSYLSDAEITDEEMISGDEKEEDIEPEVDPWRFGWREAYRRYVKLESDIAS